MAGAATLGDLSAEIWINAASASNRIFRWLVWLVGSRQQDIAKVRAFAFPWPTGISKEHIPWRVRTFNCLENAGLLENKPAMLRATFGELFRIKAMGALSVLDATTTLEAAYLAAQIHESSAVRAVDGISKDDSETLLSAVDEPWAEVVSEMDPRFAQLLPQGEGTFLERVDELTSQPYTVSTSAEEKALASSVPRIKTEIERIKRLPLETALRELLGGISRLSPAKTDALLARLGWLGGAPVTLKMAGNRLGLTRERVRQLQQQVTDKMPDHPVFMPALDRALHILREKAPMSIEVASRTLAEERVTEKPFHPSSVLSAAETLRHPATFRIEQVRGRETLVASASDVMLLAKLASLARRQAEASGASNVAEVIAEAQKIPGVAADERTLRHALERDVQFLADDWFWAPEGKPERNRLRNVTRKMLSVTSDLDLTSIREGVRREYQSRGTRGIRTWRLIVPPRSVLRRFYDAHPEFSVDANDRVSSNEPLDYQIELSYTEQILVTVLRATPACLLDRTSLLRACIERGVNEATFSAYLSYSGFIEHLGKNLWTLRGVKVDPAAVEAVRVAVSSRPRERRVLSWGWTASGAIWIAARLPEQFSGLVVGVPAGSRPYLAGQGFRAYTEDEKACGTIRVREDGMSWGYGTFLAQSGADNDDILLATFDLSAESVSLAIINDERLAELEGDV